MNKYDIDYSRIPEHTREGIQRFVEDGYIPGNFLCAVLSNDFVKVCGLADDINCEHLLEWADFLYNELPANCWGSEDKMKKWAEDRRKERT